jgi:hypothetical protein
VAVALASKLGDGDPVASDVDGAGSAGVGGGSGDGVAVGAGAEVGVGAGAVGAGVERVGGGVVRGGVDVLGLGRLVVLAPTLTPAIAAAAVDGPASVEVVEAASPGVVGLVDAGVVAGPTCSASSGSRSRYWNAAPPAPATLGPGCLRSCAPARTRPTPAPPTSTAVTAVSAARWAAGLGAR